MLSRLPLALLFAKGEEADDDVGGRGDGGGKTDTAAMVFVLVLVVRWMNDEDTRSPPPPPQLDTCVCVDEIGEGRSESGRRRGGYDEHDDE